MKQTDILALIEVFYVDMEYTPAQIVDVMEYNYGIDLTLAEVIDALYHLCLID